MTHSLNQQNDFPQPKQQNSGKTNSSQTPQEESFDFVKTASSETEKVTESSAVVEDDEEDNPNHLTSEQWDRVFREFKNLLRGGFIKGPDGNTLSVEDVFRDDH